MNIQIPPENIFKSYILNKKKNRITFLVGNSLADWCTNKYLQNEQFADFVDIYIARLDLHFKVERILFRNL